MNKHQEYLNSLVDTLIQKGRRYGLTTTYKGPLLEILSSVPYPDTGACTCDSEVAMPDALVAPELPTDTKVLEAVEATADIVVTKAEPTAAERYAEASTPAVGFRV